MERVHDKSLVSAFLLELRIEEQTNELESIWPTLKINLVRGIFRAELVRVHTECSIGDNLPSMHINRI